MQVIFLGHKNVDR